MLCILHTTLSTDMHGHLVYGQVSQASSHIKFLKSVQSRAGFFHWLIVVHLENS